MCIIAKIERRRHMNLLKFRAWDKKYKRWVYYDAISLNDQKDWFLEYADLRLIYNNLIFSIGSGHYDAWNNYIYEGDVLAYQGGVYILRFSEAFYFERVAGDISPEKLSLRDLCHSYRVGNIFEYPEFEFNSKFNDNVIKIASKHFNYPIKELMNDFLSLAAFKEPELFDEVLKTYKKNYDKIPYELIEDFMSSMEYVKFRSGKMNQRDIKYLDKLFKKITDKIMLTCEMIKEYVPEQTQQRINMIQKIQEAWTPDMEEKNE
jgi:hypothetical protein